MAGSEWLLDPQAYSILVHACAASRLPTLALSVSLFSVSLQVDTIIACAFDCILLVVDVESPQLGLALTPVIAFHQEDTLSLGSRRQGVSMTYVHACSRPRGDGSINSGTDAAYEMRL